MRGGAAARREEQDVVRSPDVEPADARRAEDDEAQEAEEQQEELPYASVQSRAMDDAAGVAPAQQPAASDDKKEPEAEPQATAAEPETSERTEEPAPKADEPEADVPPVAEAQEEPEAEVADVELGPEAAPVESGEGEAGEAAAEGGLPAAAEPQAGGAAVDAEGGGKEAAPAEAAAPPPPLEEQAAPAAHAPPPRARPRASAAAVADAQAEVDAAADAERATIADHFSQQRGQVEGTAAVQQVLALTHGITGHMQILADLTQRENDARVVFAATRASFKEIASTQAGLARQEARDAVTRLRDDAARQRQAADQHAETEGQRAFESGRQQGYRILRSRRAASDTIKAQSEETIASCDQIEDQGDRDAAKNAVRKARNQIRDKMLDQALADSDNLEATGKKNKAKLKEAATKIFKDQDKGLAEMEKEILGLATSLWWRFNQQAMAQMSKVSEAERRYLAELAMARRRAVELISQGAQAGKMIRERGRRQVAMLGQREHVAIGKVEHARGMAHAELGKHDELPRAKAGAFTEALRTQLAAGREAHLGHSATAFAEELAQLGATGAEVGARVDATRRRMGEALDGASTGVGSSLTEATTAFTNQCAIDRAMALVAYTTSFVQTTVESWAKVEEAKTDWSGKADAFAAEATTRADGQIDRHAQLVAAVPGKLEQVKKETVSNRHKHWLRRKLENAWKHFLTFAKGLLILLLVVGLSFVFGFWILIGFAIYLVVTALISRFSTLFDAWDDWSTTGKVFGVIGTVFAAVGDVFGVTYFFEGIFGSEAVTGRELSDEEASERFWIGLYSIILILATKGASRRWGGRTRPPAGEPPPGEAPPKQLPPGETAPETAPETTTQKPPAAETAPETAPEAARETAPETAPEPVENAPPRTRDLGLRDDATNALERLENLKEDPVGDVNVDPNKNHYGAARREAAGEVVARRPSDGRPYSHIGDLQQAYDGLANVERALANEVRNPPDTMTERGLEVLLKKHSEVQRLMNRLAGFLNEIGHGQFPPYHQFPPGT